MKISTKFLLAILLLGGFLVRLYKINAPLADWHSWRQADTAAVSRNFLKYGYDLLHPRFDDLSNIPSGLDNPKGYRFVEFPIYNLFHAFVFQIFTILGIDLFSFEATGRLISTLFWLMGGYFLFKSVSLLINRRAAFLTLFFFLFLPYGIFYSRTILPDPAMVALSLASIFFLLQSFSVESKIKWLSVFISWLFASTAILVKPYAVFLLSPSWLIIFAKLFLEKQNKKTIFLYSIFYILISALPFIIWRYWMQQFPEGIPANKWLLNESGIRFRPAWWRWLFGERIGKVILGFWGPTFLSLGVISKINKKNLLFFGWLLGGFLYLSIFAQGNVQHDYYQILLIPILSVFLAFGCVIFLKIDSKIISIPIRLIVLIFLTLSSFAFSWYFIRDYYQINHPEIVEAGKKADELLPEDAKVIAPYNGDTAFLYQINRQGWPAITTSVDNLIQKGAQYYISVNFDQTTNELKEKYPVIYQDKKFIIIKLNNAQ